MDLKLSCVGAHGLSWPDIEGVNSICTCKCKFLTTLIIDVAKLHKLILVQSIRILAR